MRAVDGVHGPLSISLSTPPTRIIHIVRREWWAVLGFLLPIISGHAGARKESPAGQNGSRDFLRTNLAAFSCSTYSLSFSRVPLFLVVYALPSPYAFLRLGTRLDYSLISVNRVRRIFYAIDRSIYFGSLEPLLITTIDSPRIID